MNVDVLVKGSPSIRWYFAAVVPFSALVLAIAFLSTQLNMWERKRGQDEAHKLSEKQE